MQLGWQGQKIQLVPLDRERWWKRGAYRNQVLCARLRES